MNFIFPLLREKEASPNKSTNILIMNYSDMYVISLQYPCKSVIQIRGGKKKEKGIG